MDGFAAFLTHNIVYVYFFYGLAFFSLGLVVILEAGRASEFRFVRALPPLALFGFIHGAHEWFEMFQIFAAHVGGQTTGLVEEILRLLLLASSFVCLLTFGVRLLPDAEAHPRASYGQVIGMVGIWLATIVIVYLRQRPALAALIVAADVLARYVLGITGALLAAWSLLRERYDFHIRGMSSYGQALLWAALAFFIYGVVGQLFVRPSIVAPSHIVNTALFVRLFGFPVQLLRGAAALAITITLGSALRAFEAESRLRLARANKSRIEAQAAALEAQSRRTQEVEALNVQLRETARELSALLEMSRTLNATIELERVVHYALYQVAHSFEGACCTAIFLKHANGALELSQTYFKPQASRPEMPPPFEALARRTIESGQAVGMDLAAQMLTLEEMDAEGHVAAEASRARYRALAAPLLLHDESVGSLVVAVGDDDRFLTDQDLNLLVAFARQITTSVENARLYRVVQERETRLAELFRQLVSAQEGERQRIARELHDETGQKLTALAMGLAALETNLDGGEVASARRLARHLREVSDQAIVELRHIMSDLRPALLDDLGLTPALRSLVHEFTMRHPETQISFAADRPAARLAPEYEIVLFRVAQEALNNIARHAQATQVTIRLEHRVGRVRLEIDDNGVGFDPKTPSRHPSGSGLGLAGMQERVALIGGRWQVQSAPGQGTRITVELPIPGELRYESNTHPAGR